MKHRLEETPSFAEGLQLSKRMLFTLCHPSIHSISPIFQHEVIVWESISFKMAKKEKYDDDVIL